MNRRALLAMLHIARKDLGLDEDTYRAVLERVTGSSSAARLTDHEIAKVVDAFRLQGWVPKRNGQPTTKRSAPHVRKVWAIWGDMCKAGIPREPTRHALRAFVERMTGVADPEWLDAQQTNVVVEALKAWQVRERAGRNTKRTP